MTPKEFEALKDRITDKVVGRGVPQVVKGLLHRELKFLVEIPCQIGPACIWIDNRCAKGCRGEGR